MLGLKRSPLKVFKHNSVVPGNFPPPRSNPFDSDDKTRNVETLEASRTTSSEKTLLPQNLGINPFDDDYDGERVNSFPTQSLSYAAAQNRYRNDFRDSGGLENQSLEELENYALYKALETTKNVNNCLKIAEEIRGEATNTLVTLHQQGEQITRIHETAAGIDHDLRRGEKLLGSLGGMFSRTWKPQKTRNIVGPIIARDDSSRQRGSHLQQREKLGLNSAPKVQSRTRTKLPEPTNSLQKVEFEKAKQDNALSDLSDLVGELKNMALDMGSEISRQNNGLDPLQDDVDELTSRAKGANQRLHRLLRK